MRLVDGVFLLLNVVLSVGGMLLIKQNASAGLTATREGALVVVGAGLYVAGFLIWMIVLARNELSVVYPIAVGSALVASSLAATIWLGETIGFLRVSGMVMILLGVVAIVRS